MDGSSWWMEVSSNWMEISVWRYASPHPVSLSNFLLLLFLLQSSTLFLFTSLSSKLSSASMVSNSSVCASLGTFSLAAASTFLPVVQPSRSTVRRGTLHLEYSLFEFKMSSPLRSILTASDSWRDRGSWNDWMILNLNLGGARSSAWSVSQCFIW